MKGTPIDLYIAIVEEMPRKLKQKSVVGKFMDCSDRDAKDNINVQTILEPGDYIIAFLSFTAWRNRKILRTLLVGTGLHLQEGVLVLGGTWVGWSNLRSGPQAKIQL